MNLPVEFALAAVIARADPRDALVSNRYSSLAALPQGARVGTSSLRRESQLRAKFPHFAIEPLRGNVQTRLRKLDAGEYDAIILAAAGLKRLGLDERITAILTPEELLPAVGQGALGVECLASRADIVTLLAPLNDAATLACVTAERALSRALAGSCNVPIAGFAETSGGQMRMRAYVGAPDGTRHVRGERTCTLRGAREDATREADALGTALAAELRAGGASAILAALENT